MRLRFCTDASDYHQITGTFPQPTADPPDFEEGFEGVDPQPLHERINQALSSIGALVLSDYAKGALASVQQMIQLARKAGVPVLIDPKVPILSATAALRC